MKQTSSLLQNRAYNNEMIYLTVLPILFLLSSQVSSDKDSSECLPKSYGQSSVVCVCNIKHCDRLGPVQIPDTLSATVVTSSLSGKRWKQSMYPIAIKTERDIYDGKLNFEADVVIEVNPKKRYQKIYGFGGAFTDATGINLESLLPFELDSVVLKGYYGEEGLEYNLGRVPIGGTDFSTYPYSYDDLPPGDTDEELKYFKLQKEDKLYKIPYIQQAQNISKGRGVDLKLYCSPWSSPGWMKTNGKINGKGRLFSKYYPTWASYIIRFLDEYLKYGINFEVITAQNEPTPGLFVEYSFNTIGWTPTEQGKWIANHLGPALRESGKNVTIYIGDDQRFVYPLWVEKVLKVPGAKEYVGGIAVHWYYDNFIPAFTLDLTHKMNPSLPILYTEACTGPMPWDSAKVILGSWERAEDYMENIIQDLQHWVVGWTDWNLALDTEGGPNWVENFVDSPIIVNKTAGEFYRQPMFYALAHVSKVLPEGSERLGIHLSGNMAHSIKATTFERTDGNMATIILNKHNSSVRIEVHSSDNSFHVNMEERSITSIIWRI